MIIWLKIWDFKYFRESCMLDIYVLIICDLIFLLWLFINVKVRYNIMIYVVLFVWKFFWFFIIGFDYKFLKKNIFWFMWYLL